MECENYTDIAGVQLILGQISGEYHDIVFIVFRDVFGHRD